MDNIDFNIKKESLCEMIADKLEYIIMNDSIQVEEKLPSEQSLAVSFKVSRPVIREALKILKERGLIQQKNGEGTFVSEPDPHLISSTIKRILKLKKIDFMSVYEVRLALETMSVHLATENATEDDFVELERIIQETDENKHDIEKRTEMDLLFHKKISEISGNALLVLFIEVIADLLKPLINETLSLPNASQNGIDYHRNILNALKSRDPDKAEDVLRSHLVTYIRNYEAIKSNNSKT